MSTKPELMIWTSEDPLFSKNLKELRWFLRRPGGFTTLGRVRLNYQRERKFDSTFVAELKDYCKRQSQAAIPTVNVIILGTGEALDEARELPVLVPPSEGPGPGIGLGPGNTVVKIINEILPLEHIGCVLLGPFPMNTPLTPDHAIAPMERYDDVYRAWAQQWDTLVTSARDPENPQTWALQFVDPTEWFCYTERPSGVLVMEEDHQEDDGMALTPDGIFIMAREIEYEVKFMLKLVTQRLLLREEGPRNLVAPHPRKRYAKEPQSCPDSDDSSLSSSPPSSPDPDLEAVKADLQKEIPLLGVRRTLPFFEKDDTLDTKTEKVAQIAATADVSLDDKCSYVFDLDKEKVHVLDGTASLKADAN